MEITKEKLEVLFGLEEQQKNATSGLSDKIKEVKTKENLNNEIEIERNGKKIKVKESVLWFEVQNHPEGANCQAGKVLAEKYPEVFQNGDNLDDVNKKLSEFLSLEFGIVEKATVTDLIRINMAVFDYKMKEATRKDYYRVLSGVEYPRGVVHEKDSIIELRKFEADTFADGLIEKDERKESEVPPSA